MPHDRLFLDKDKKLSTMSYIQIERNEKGEEVLSEVRDSIKDELC